MDHEEVERLLENKNSDNHKSSQDRERRIVQLDMYGDIVQEIDSEIFRHNFPKKPYDNSSIITFQNTGQLPQNAYAHKLIQMAQAFKDSKANIAMYVELLINDKLMTPNKNLTTE